MTGCQARSESVTEGSNLRDAMAWGWNDDGGAARLDKLLRDAGLNSTRVADELNVDRSLVSRWRSGERVPDAEQLAAMVILAHGSADDVLGVAPPRGVQPHLVDVLRAAGQLQAAFRALAAALAQGHDTGRR